MNKSYLTAIKRKKLSAPMAYLFYTGLLKDKFWNFDCNSFVDLDYGCGKGDDADRLGAAKYDPHYFPDKPKGKFDLITCIYVLNVLQPAEQMNVIENVWNLLRPGGVAYFAVCRDLKMGGWTKKGTFQCTVLMEEPIVFENSRFCIYSLTKPTK